MSPRISSPPIELISMHTVLSASSHSLRTIPINPNIPESKYPPPTLLTLPTELLTLILHFLPPSSLRTLRLTSRRLETLSFPLLFAHVPNWLDYKTSHAAIVALANDAFERPSGMWSPWASEPDEEVRGLWLGILWRVEMKGPFMVDWEGGEGGEEGVLVEGVDGERVWLTASNYARLSGREEMYERRLRVAQNRYLMHKDYSNGVGKKVVELKEEDGKERMVREIEVGWEEKEL